MDGRFASPSIEEVQHERKMLSVYAAALHCGLCRGLPCSVCRDGARGWYSIFCRRWYLRLVCTKVDAGGKEVKKPPLMLAKYTKTVYNKPMKGGELYGIF